MKTVYVAAIMFFTAMLVSLCTTLPVHAGVLARAHNEAGGQIVLLDEQGSCPQLVKNLMAFEMFSASPKGTFIEGCWTYKDEHVVVRYKDGTWRRYDPNKFVVEEVRK